MPTILTTEIIAAAIDGFEAQKTRIDAQIAELRALLPGGSAESAAKPEAPTGKRKKFSAAARQHMKEAQQRRWAKIRGESAAAAPAATPEPAKAKRKLSKAGRANIVAALKKRCAAKTAEAKFQSPAAKKTARKKATTKAAKKVAPVKKAKAAKKTAPAAAPATTETGGQ